MEEKKLPANIPAWFIEFFKRFALKTPKFFQVLQLAGIIATVAGFIPDILVWLSITPNEVVSKYLTVILKVAGATTWIVSKLPATNVTAVIDNSNALPFTEKKKVEGVDPPVEKTIESLAKQ